MEDGNLAKEESLTMELLRELKEQNRSSDEKYKNIVKVLITVIILWALSLCGIIGGFIWYLNQYDFSSYEVNSQDGGTANYIGDGIGCIANDGGVIDGIRPSEETN